MTMTYSDPTHEADPHSIPDREVFHLSKMEFIWSDPGTVQGIMLAHAMTGGVDRFAAAAELSGWYWCVCMHGCLPDLDPIGPFDTEALALADAQDTGD